MRNFKYHRPAILTRELAGIESNGGGGGPLHAEHIQITITSVMGRATRSLPISKMERGRKTI
jgi:hypothetical protein